MRKDIETRLLPWLRSHTLIKWLITLAIIGASAAMLFCITDAPSIRDSVAYYFIFVLFVSFMSIWFNLMKDPAVFKRDPVNPRWSQGGLFIVAAFSFLVMVVLTIIVLL